MSTITCRNCGQPNADIARICRYCGTGLLTNAQNPSRPPAYAPPPQTDFNGQPLWASDAPPAPVRSFTPSPPPAYAPPQAQPLQAHGHFRCPHCNSDAPPVIAKRIGAPGWIVFFALLIFCFPLCFIGLFIKEEYRMCSWCRGAIA